MKLRKLLSLTGMALAGGLLLAGHAHAGIFVIDDFNTAIREACSDPVSGNDTVACGAPTPITGNNVVWEFADRIDPPLGAGLTINPQGPNNATRTLSAVSFGPDFVTAEVCNVCQAGHHVSGAGGTTGNTDFQYDGPSVDVTEFGSVMLHYAADQDGAVIRFTFDDGSGNVEFVETGPLANTGNSDIANGVPIMLRLPAGVDYSDLTSARIDIFGVPDLDLTIDNFKLVPEPTTLAMLGLGLLGLGWHRRRQAG